MNTEERLTREVARMSTDELVNVVYKDVLTSIWNRRAFGEVNHKGPVAICDLDGLKWINDNLSYRYGDTALCLMVEALEKWFPDSVYRLGGDEFAVLADSREALLGGLLLAQGTVNKGHLMNSEFFVGGPGQFSFGIGDDLMQANTLLKDDKAGREACGLRAPHGEAPKGAIPRLSLVTC